MGMTPSDIAWGRAHSIAGTMRTEAGFENKPNHVRHVENQIRYADSVGEAVTQEIKEWVAKELPIMIAKEVEKYMQKPQIKVKVDERSFAEAKKKVSELFRSIFH